MSDERIRELLRTPPTPGEGAAEERSWQVVRAAFDAHPPRAPKRAGRARPLLALAAVLVLVAAAFTSPGRAVLRSLRDAVGTEGVRNARPALFSLPTGGRVLVNGPGGAWIVRRDGSKRRLGSYRDASWSPHGLFVAAARGRELFAMTPRGEIRWSLARARPVRFPRWSLEPAATCCRIAYLAGPALRIVYGNGKDDTLLARRVAPVAPVWRPQTRQLAYVDAAGRLRVEDTDRRRVIWSRRLRPDTPRELAWSDDGRVLLARGRTGLWTFTASGRPLLALPTKGDTVAAAFAPGRHTVAFVIDRHGVLVVDGEGRTRRTRVVFTGAGRFGDLAWSPDGRWLLLAWPSADQWLFIRSASARKVIAVSNIARSFDPRHPKRRAPPDVAGWCCSE